MGCRHTSTFASIAAAAFLLCALCAGRLAAASPDALVQGLDALHAHRDDPGMSRTLADKLASASPADRDDFEVLWRTARLKVWLGEVATDPAAKRTLGADAAALARKALALRPQRVEGHYYTALGVGIYCLGVGVIKILREGRDREFTEELDRALAIDPYFNAGGPLLAKGRYFFELPWPMRDVKKAIDYYRRVLARFRYQPRARLFLAEALLRDDRAAEADSELARLFEGDEGRDPAETRRVQALAVDVRARVAKELRR
jgi:predicted Zn-dependent protease